MAVGKRCSGVSLMLTDELLSLVGMMVERCGGREGVRGQACDIHSVVFSVAEFRPGT